MTNPAPMKCNCGKDAVVEFRGRGNMCEECVGKLEKSSDGHWYPASEMVTDELGRRVNRAQTRKYKDGITGKSFFSVDPFGISGVGKVTKRTMLDLCRKGEVVEVQGRYTLKKDVLYDDAGCPLLAENSDKRNCEYCGKTFERQRDTEGICVDCRIKHDCLLCVGCGSVIKDFDFVRKFNSTPGTVGFLPIVCPKCLKYYMPFFYNSRREIEGEGRKIGVEVECEPTPESQKKLALWVGKNGDRLVTGSEDGSLRGPYPAEFVSPILHESNYEEWVDKFCSLLEARVYIRCGLHIHIETSDLSWFEIMNLMAYCKKHEGFFFSCVSPSRRTGADGARNAGLPIILPQIPKGLFTKEKFLNFLYGRERLDPRIGFNIAENKRANDRNVHYSGKINRYQWLNVHGHFFKGAIEVRLHQGTTNPVKIKNWIEFWLNIIPHAAMRPKDWLPPMKVLPRHLEKYYERRIKELNNLANEKQIVFK